MNLPVKYHNLSPPELDRRIHAAKVKLGKNVLILAHNYQRDEVIKWADFTGDSLHLAQVAIKSTAPYIVFCGVHFMAETADILTKDEQVVTLPDSEAGCPMADMANLEEVKEAWKILTNKFGKKIIPITYINSKADLKAFCGDLGGIVCTSGNAEKIMKWAFTQSNQVLFFPDENLGINTGFKIGLKRSEIATWDWTAEKLISKSEKPKLIVWKGYCPVHVPFSVKDIENFRAQIPGIKILVHPECIPEVAAKADLVGSTSFIIETIEKAKSKNTSFSTLPTASPERSRMANCRPLTIKWAIGTEIHLVNRLKNDHPEQEIHILNPVQCMCAMMDRTSPEHLLWNLESLVASQVVNQIQVPPQIKASAKKALEKMLRNSN